MNPPESLLQAAHRDADPTAALACADWYDEHDQPDQARLMRLSVRLEQLGPGHPDAVAIELEAEKLRLWLEWRWRVNGDEFDGPSGELGASLARGLPRWWVGRLASRVVEELTYGFDHFPVRGFDTNLIASRQLRDLLRSPLGVRLARLQLRACENALEPCLRELANAFGQVELVECALDFRMNEVRSQTFSWEGLSTVRRLACEGSSHLPAVIEQLRRSSFGCHIQDVTLAEFGPQMSFTERQLTQLGDPVRGWPVESWTTRGVTYADRALTAMTQPAFWPHLKNLDIQGALPFPSLDAVAVLMQQGRLRSLQLSRQSHAVLNAPRYFAPESAMPGLRRLNWTAGRTGSIDAEQMAAWPGLRSLTDLSLNFDHLSPDALRALMQSPHAESIQRLSLQTPLTTNHQDQLSDGITGAPLKWFEMRSQCTTSQQRDSLIRLFRSPGFCQLKRLAFGFEDLPSELVTCMNQWDMPTLEWLTLTNRLLEPTTIRSILQLPGFPRLSVLEIQTQTWTDSISIEELPAGWHLLSPNVFIHPERLR